MLQLNNNVGTDSTGDLPKRLWTQLRHLSHMDRKNRSQIYVGNAAVGVQGDSIVWAVNASSIPCFVVPTSRNLAVASPGVNKIGRVGYANVRQRRLPARGTSRCPK
jgi:hypothetical protein